MQGAVRAVIAQQRLTRLAALVQQGEAQPQATILMNAADDIKCDFHCAAFLAGLTGAVFFSRKNMRWHGDIL